jgi:hypothetical protein
MSSPEPKWRWIAPHALGNDGFRWHVRAFCESDGRFKDFVLSRIQDLGGSRPASASPDADEEWSSEITLIIGPHPDLSASQKKAIALDYGMIGEKAEVRVRRALLYYTLKRLGGIPPQMLESLRISTSSAEPRGCRSIPTLRASVNDGNTQYHTKLFAHELLRRKSVADAEKLAVPFSTPRLT